MTFFGRKWFILPNYGFQALENRDSLYVQATSRLSEIIFSILFISIIILIPILRVRTVSERIPTRCLYKQIEV